MEKGSLTRKQPIKNAYFLLTEVIGKRKKKNKHNLLAINLDYNLYNKMQSKIYIMQHMCNVSLQPQVSKDRI